MIINFFYGGKLMDSVVTSHADGCRISPGQPPLVQHRSPYGLPDSLQNVCFPPAELIEVERQRHVTRKLLGHLERGVLVRANREGIFIKRLCQSRVFWSGLGGMGPHYSPGGPCKLERDDVVKIFDTGRFFQGEEKGTHVVFVVDLGCCALKRTGIHILLTDIYSLEYIPSLISVQL
jgi:interferon regulatory factor 8